jgi:hypothetical protein
MRGEVSGHIQGRVTTESSMWSWRSIRKENKYFWSYGNTLEGMHDLT